MTARALIAAIVVLAVLGIGIVVAQPNCTGESCDYLPAVAVPGATATRTPTRTPLPQPPENVTCLVRGPAPAEGVQVWLTGYNLAPGDRVWACARFTRDGRPVPGVLIRVLARYPDQARQVDQGLTKVDGVLALPLVVAAVAPAQLIVVEAEAETDSGLVGGITQFLSQPRPTSTPIVSR